jgi:hypothetical protein
MDVLGALRRSARATEKMQRDDDLMATITVFALIVDSRGWWADVGGFRGMAFLCRLEWPKAKEMGGTSVIEHIKVPTLRDQTVIADVIMTAPRFRAEDPYRYSALVVNPRGLNLKQGRG